MFEGSFFLKTGVRFLEELALALVSGSCVGIGGLVYVDRLCRMFRYALHTVCIPSYYNKALTLSKTVK